MNLKLAKLYRRLVAYKPGAETQYNAKWEGNARVGNRVLVQRVVPISPLVEGYFWKPHTPIAKDGTRHVRMPVTCRGARGQYRRAKAMHRAANRLDTQSVL